ncbi:MAG TPA: hypothetical protein VHH34_03825, partial [Pseudonocardiaceae bacterium]|nr:hypothetical protein [Pseudonocardiaceae bacterium]
AGEAGSSAATAGGVLAWIRGHAVVRMGSGLSGSGDEPGGLPAATLTAVGNWRGPLIRARFVGFGVL